MFPHLDIPFEYWIEHVTCGLLYAMLSLSTKGSSRLCNWLYLPSLVLWINHLPLYVGPLFGNLVWNDNGFVSFTKWRITFSLLLSSFTYILMPHNVAIIYFRLPFSMSQIVLYFLHCTLVLSFYTDVVLTRSIHNLSYWTWITGDRLNMNIPYRLTSIGIPIVKIRLSHDRLIFTLGIL